MTLPDSAVSIVKCDESNSVARAVELCNGLKGLKPSDKVLINVPVLKTHGQCKVSLGMKNLKGCLSMSSKRAFHGKDLHRMIALLNTKIKPKLTIIDGLYAMEHGPSALGLAHRMNLL